MTTPVRWGVLGTANIAAHAFLPAMRDAGDVATVVGSRDPQRGAAWAADNQVERAGSYDDVLSAGDVDAIYVAVPNDSHVEWAARAASTGKAVLCEKPLGLDLAEVDGLLAQVGDALLWEAFVFPFHPQTELLRRLCAADGPIGGVREISSEFHFRVTRSENIRWDAARGGGALLDVGCYPIRLARLLFGADVAEHAAGDSGARIQWRGRRVRGGARFPGGAPVAVLGRYATVPFDLDAHHRRHRRAAGVQPVPPARVGHAWNSGRTASGRRSGPPIPSRGSNTRRVTSPTWCVATPSRGTSPARTPAAMRRCWICAGRRSRP